MKVEIKGKLFRTVVRPALVYEGGRDIGSEEGTGKKLEVAEMRMPRWASGVKKLDRIRNERIRGTTKVGEISGKVR